ncbi:MAG: ECF transporter S component [Clostridia bacterium]|nr:ECF transporter S component [Clostridia bacterium]
MRKINLKRLTLASVLLALGMVLPLLTGQIKEIGDSLLPMHLAIMLCGLICGWKYGAVTGAVLPFLRSIVFGMPKPYPNAVWMSLELCTYGFVIGLLYSLSSKKPLWYLYPCLLASMVSGRIVWGIAKAVLLGIDSIPFTMEMFITGGIIDALPGIALQLILIPVIIAVYNRLSKESVTNC